MEPTDGRSTQKTTFSTALSPQVGSSDVGTARTEVARGGSRGVDTSGDTPAGEVEGLANNLNGLLIQSERRGRHPADAGSSGSQRRGQGGGRSRSTRSEGAWRPQSGATGGAGDGPPDPDEQWSGPSSHAAAGSCACGYCGGAHKDVHLDDGRTFKCKYKADEVPQAEAIVKAAAEQGGVTTQKEAEEMMEKKEKSSVWCVVESLKA